MRVIFTIIIAISVIALHALDNPQRFGNLLSKICSSAATLWHEKEVRIDGLSLLSRIEVEKLLPLDRSVAWWRLNDTEIQSRLERNPWVGKTSISSCSEGRAADIGCFIVSVTERTPTFVAFVDSAQWIIDRDGSFIAPLNDLRGRDFKGRLISVRGLASRVSSPDMLRAQLSAASRLLEIIEKEVGRPITALEFLGQGDFAVALKGLSFPVIFAAGKDAKVPLVEQGARCSELIKHIGGRISEVAKIDLAFDRVGVVTFKPSSLEPIKPAA